MRDKQKFEIGDMVLIHDSKFPATPTKGRIVNYNEHHDLVTAEVDDKLMQVSGIQCLKGEQEREPQVLWIRKEKKGYSVSDKPVPEKAWSKFVEVVE